MNVVGCFPRSWRDRYGKELTELIADMQEADCWTMRARIDIVGAGLAERARILGRNEHLPAKDRVQEGTLLVLYAWTLFTLGGVGIQKASEHWQAATPHARQALPAHAYTILCWTAAAGSTLVLIGALAAAPAILGRLREVESRRLEPALRRALLLTLLTLTATAALVAWGHSLTSAQRNGSDDLYGAAFVVWLTLIAITLLGWAVGAAEVARRLELPRSVRRLQTALATMVTCAMTVMLIASGVWWLSVAKAAPWFFSGRPVGQRGAVIEPSTSIPLLVMVAAVVLAVVGTRNALLATRTTDL